MPTRIIDISTKLILDDYTSLKKSRKIEYFRIEDISNENYQVIQKIISKEPYLPDKKLVEAVNLAMALGRPLLLQGEPGCGKTRLAYAVAYALGLPLEESYIKSTSRAQDLLYTYDAVNRLYDAQLGNPKSQNIKNYIRLGSLGKAIVRAHLGGRSVVLIDEIDKADLDFPNDLLWELDRLEFCVNEAINTYYKVEENKPELRPIVFITHNEEKALPTAFLRRCIFYYVEFPQTEDDLLKILATHKIINQNLSKAAIEVLLELRTLDLSKKPGLSELLDWVGYLQAVETPYEKLDELPYLGALLKQETDRRKAIDHFGVFSNTSSIEDME
ncbi:MoxR family ATPase [Nostoc sp. ATCC 53789]|uniref:AAA family ATPase n=1 Tax=Nostoc sp. ATCC 53789 TaxID=76335 RepID=UPI000DECF358|nr:MoxR family ATPase [Nostoc sp. ATCC 53789]QHG21214.1 AAA domain-containing protein [Nostoc sp. ATCC 53789]RCJ16894.1 AAA family ATPase [Nostoc sp. ATCC 53789]